jgi:Flp pilus assembly protein protease CpaA
MIAIIAVVLSGTMFGASAFLALQLARRLYGDVVPFADGPRPGQLRPAVPIVIAAFLGALLAGLGDDLPTLAFFDAISFALCAVVWTDVTRGIVGDWFTLPVIGLALALAALRGDIFPVSLSAAFVTAPFAIAALTSRGRGFGWGDVKLVALGALVLDLQTSIIMFALTCLVASAIAYALKRGKEPLPLAPYLAAAIALGLLLPETRHIV